MAPKTKAPLSTSTPAGGGSVFLPLLDASIFGGSITSSFFNMFVFQVSDNLNILFSSDKSFIGKKRRLSIIK